MYHNLGFVTGTLRFAPRQVSEGVVLLTVKVMGSRLDTSTGERKRVPFFPTFTIFGREAHKALVNLVEGQRVELEYRLETRTKVVAGEKKFFEDKVVSKITYGEKPAGYVPTAAPKVDGPLKPEHVAVEEDDHGLSGEDPSAHDSTEVVAAPAQRHSAFGNIRK